MTESKPTLQQGFADVAQQQQDPALFFRMLDMQAAHPAIVSMRARALDLLGPASGGRFLDVGCGTGEFARALGERVVPGGIVSGVDASPTMIGEARRRTGDGPLIEVVEFAEEDAQSLRFADETFDGVHCERVLQHLPDPDRALGEFVRVAKPGAAIVIADTDWETAVLGPLDPDVDRRLRTGLAMSFPNGLIGRRLFAMMHKAGLAGVAIGSESLIFTEWDEERFIGPPIGRLLPMAQEQGLLTASEAETARAAVVEAAASGTFFASVTMFLASGRKPATDLS
ncbi:MAG TPA: methyltransferase domain-containing protein [Actinomycetota bacterium]